MRRKHKAMLVAAAAFLGIGAVGTFPLFNQINPTVSTANDLEYGIRLDSGDAYVSGETKDITTLSGKAKVIFSYTGASASAGSHCALASGGSIVNVSQITSITSFTATFDGALKARLSFDGSHWGEAFSLGSGIKVSTSSNPYFIKIEATSDAVVHSLAFTYSCSPNPEISPSQDESLLGVIDFYDKSTLGNTDSTAAVTEEYLDGHSFESLSGAAANIADVETADYVYAGRYGGVGFSSNKNGGELSLTLNKDYQSVTKVVVNAAAKEPTKALTLNDISLDVTTTVSDSAIDADPLIWEFEEPVTDLQFSAKTGAKIGLYRISLYSNDVAQIPANPDRFAIGFTANLSKTTYYGDEKFNPATLSASVQYSDGTSAATENFTYTVTRQGSSTPININSVFADTEGYDDAGNTYVVTVSYGDFIAQKFNLSVSTRATVTSVTADLNKLTYNTAEVFDTSSLTVGIHYSLPVKDREDLGYDDLADFGLQFALIDPKGVDHDISTAFGSAGTWKAKVSLIEDPTIYDQMEFTVEAIPVTGISLDQTSLTLEEGKTAQLIASVTPSDATNADVEWGSSNASIASVDATGKVTAVAEGQATITATSKDGTNVFGSCVVTVTAKQSAPDEGEFTLSSSATLTIGSYIVFTSPSDSETAYAMAAQNNNNRAATEVSIKNGKLLRDADDTFRAFRVEAGTTTGTYSFYDEQEEGYLYAASSSNNQLKTESTKSANSSFAVSGSESKELTAQGSNSRNRLQWNSNSSIFSCYASGQADPYIFEKAGDPVYPTAISISGSAEVGIGATTQLSVAFTPSNTTMKSIRWESDDSLIAVVNNGLVQGVKAGSTTIRAYAKNAAGADIETSFPVTVKTIPVSSVSLNKSALTLTKGATETLVASISPSNATNQNVTWSTSDNGVATVSDGVVTAIDAGKATITVTTQDGSKQATCAITVSAESQTGAIDVIDNAATKGDIGGVGDSTWTDFTINGASGSTYAIHSLGLNKGSHALQWNASGYLYSTKSGGKISSVSAKTTNGKAIEVFGSNEAFSGNSGGTSLGQISGEGSLTPAESYTFIRIKGTSSSTQVTSISITYGELPKIDPTGISLSESSLELSAGASKTLSVNYSPSDANQNKAVTWSTSNANAATVDTSGKVTIPSSATVGAKATITATLNFDPNIKASCQVEVVERQIDAYTILIYMCGADLESGSKLATGDLREILNVSGQPDNVNVVIETGGASKWATTYGISKDYLQRHHVENKKLVHDESLTKVSMGKASTLQSFVEYGLSEFPAVKTSLVLWNHGGAMDGVCFDENFSNDSLTNAEVNSAMDGAFKAFGMSADQDQLEWIGYDACLMAVQDIAEFNSHYFNYMVASQETEGGYGWDYDRGWLGNLYKNPQISTESLLTQICQNFIADNSSESTLSVMDLSKMSAYLAAWENMAVGLSSIITSSSAWNTFANLVNQCKKFGYYSDSDYASYNNGYVYDVFDAKDLITKMQANSTYKNALSSQLSALSSAFTSVVKYSGYTSDYSGSHGLNFFCPLCGLYKASDFSSTYTAFAKWSALCVKYGKLGK